MLKDLRYILTNFNRLSPREWDNLNKFVIDGLIGYPTLTEGILEDNISVKMQEWIYKKSELMRLDEDKEK